MLPINECEGALEQTFKIKTEAEESKPSLKQDKNNQARKKKRPPRQDSQLREAQESGKRTARASGIQQD